MLDFHMCTGIELRFSWLHSKYFIIRIIPLPPNDFLIIAHKPVFFEKIS